MATTKKYAGLPDLDDAGTELYQTPGLTDDASTIQTSTLRTESPTPSERSNEHFDRTRFDREEARKRFEPAVVDARDVNFSYAVGGSQKSYSARRRRRRRVQSNGLEVLGDISDEAGSETEETLGEKLARLKREAEEVRLEIERKDKEEGEFQDTFEHPPGGSNHEENDGEMSRRVDELNQVLNGLQTSLRPKQETLEEEFRRRLDRDTVSQRSQIQGDTSKSVDASTRSNISAISAFSDRISAVESALGLSTATPASGTTAILSTIDTLTNQINLLHSILIPKSTLSATTQSAPNSNAPPQIPYLDDLQTRLHSLHSSANSLLAARKAAQTALTDLETVRLRGIRNADTHARYQALANRRAGRPVPAANTNPGLDSDEETKETTYPISRGGPTRRSIAADEAKERMEIADEIVTPLFLEEQAEKIKALYSILPTIHNLQPLLPIVLERLRGLSVVHAGAAGAREDMDEIESRLRAWEVDLGKWKEAVQGVENGIEEMKGIMKENVEVVGGMVQTVEERIAQLDGK